MLYKFAKTDYSVVIYQFILLHSINYYYITNVLYFHTDAISKTKFKDSGLKNINRAIMNGLRTCSDWNGRSRPVDSQQINTSSDIEMIDPFSI